MLARLPLDQCPTPMMPPPPSPQVPNPEEVEQARAEAARMRSAVAAKLRGREASRGGKVAGVLRSPGTGPVPAAPAPGRDGSQIVQAEIQLVAPSAPPLATLAAPAAAGPEPRLQSPGSGAGGELGAPVFEPITLAFRDIRYFVPNPTYVKAAARARATAARSASGSPRASGDIEAPPGGGGSSALAGPAGAAGKAAAAGVDAEAAAAAAAAAENAARLAATPRLELLKVRAPGLGMGMGAACKRPCCLPGMPRY
jgi:hypothetical protein